MKHEVKTDPEVFEDVLAGLKTFEIRRDDRSYAVGDILLLKKTRYRAEQMREGKPLEYTGAVTEVGVSHILRGPIFGLADGWVIMSIRNA